MPKSELTIFKEKMKLRTKRFAHDCVKFSLNLPNSPLGRHVQNQLIRSSTSVAANYRASCVAQTIPAVIAKISISIEEADESEFWLEFSKDENLSSENETQPLVTEANEIASILIKSRKTLQNKVH